MNWVTSTVVLSHSRARHCSWYASTQGSLLPDPALSPPRNDPDAC